MPITNINGNSSAVGGNFVSDPNLLPLATGKDYDEILLKNGESGAYYVGDSSFWTAVDDPAVGNGGYVSIGYNVNSWATLAEITGGGVVSTIISPKGTSQDGQKPGIRINVDGLEREFVSASYGRMVLGAYHYRPYYSFAVDGGSTRENLHNPPAPGSQYDVGFSTYAADTVIGIPRVDQVLAFRLSCLRFEKYLKVEVKGYSSDTDYRKGGLLYQLDQGV